MKTHEEPINCAEVLKNAAQSALAGYESSIAHGGVRDQQQEDWIVALFCGMNAISQVDELKQRLEQAERERDAFERCLKNVKDNLIFSSETYVGLKQNVYYALMNIAQTMRELGRGFVEENTKEE